MPSNEELSKLVASSFARMGIDKPDRQMESQSNRADLLIRRDFVNIGILALTVAQPGNQSPFTRRQSLGLLLDVAGDWGTSGDWGRLRRRVFAVAEVSKEFDGEDAGRIYLFAEAPELRDKDPRLLKLHTAAKEFVRCTLVGSEYPPFISPVAEIVDDVYEGYDTAMSRVEHTVARLTSEFAQADSTSAV